MFPSYKALFLLGAVTFVSHGFAFAQDDEDPPVKQKKIVKVVKVIRKKKSVGEDEPKEEEISSVSSKADLETDDEIPKKNPVSKKTSIKKAVVREEAEEEPEIKKIKPKKKIVIEEDEEVEVKKPKVKKSALKEDVEIEQEPEPEVKKSKSRNSRSKEESETPDVKEDIVVEEKNDDAPKLKKSAAKKEKEEIKNEPEKLAAQEEENESSSSVVFDRYTRPQLYFSPGAPWRIVYFSPNITYQGIVPVEGDTNLSLKDKDWCLNLKTKEPKKNCDDQEFLEKVAKKCEDVQVFSCIDRARESSWAKEKWKTKDQIIDGIQNIFHEGMEGRIREFVDRGGKLPWVPTPPWCMNVSPKSCSDLSQVDPRNGVNQGGKNFMMSAENCHFYEIAGCTAEAIDSNWAKQKWGNDLEKIRAGINEFLFENHLKRISRYAPSVKIELEKAKK